MKIYVDELPKSCGDCKFKVFIAHYQNGWEHSERYCSIMKDNYDCRCSKEHCPLQSLAEHDKQVRRQVCDEIREKMTHWEDCLTKEVTEYVIDKDTLDQIQGEIK